MSSDRSSLITTRPPGLVDVLDRILDKGLVIAGDIKVSLANVELLTIQIRLLVCSIDKAEQIGLDWWRHDTNLSKPKKAAASEVDDLRRRVGELESAVKGFGAAPLTTTASVVGSSRKGQGSHGRSTKRKRS